MKSIVRKCLIFFFIFIIGKDFEETAEKCRDAESQYRNAEKQAKLAIFSSRLKERPMTIISSKRTRKMFKPKKPAAFTAFHHGVVRKSIPRE